MPRKKEESKKEKKEESKKEKKEETKEKDVVGSRGAAGDKILMSYLLEIMWNYGTVLVM